MSDKRFRMAVMHLWNRDQEIEKVFQNDLVKQDSHWPLSEYSSPNRIKYDYDPEKAAQLLDEMGYTERDSEGIRMNKDGEKLEFNVVSRNYAYWVQLYILLQSDLKKGGIKINLNSVDFATWVKTIGDRKFDFTISLYTGIPFPNPTSSLDSELADKKANNNVAGIKNPKIDELLKKYAEMTEMNDEAIGYIQQIDQILSEEAYFGYAFMKPYAARVIYWDRFGHPDSFNDYNFTGIIENWWFDKEKSDEIDKFLAGDESIKFERESLVSDYWKVKPDSYNPK